MTLELSERLKAVLDGFKLISEIEVLVISIDVLLNIWELFVGHALDLFFSKWRIF